MTLDTYRPYIGRVALVSLSGVNVQVRVLDIRSAFGRIDAHVTPIAGKGVSWMEFERLTFEETKPSSTRCHICRKRLTARDRKTGNAACLDCTIEALQ